MRIHHVFGKRFSRALAITTAGTLIMASAAFANDKLTSDADLVAGGLQRSYTNNALAAGDTATFTFSLYVEVENGGQEPTYPINVDIASKPSWVAADTSFPITINGTGTANAVSVSFAATGQPAATSGDITFKALKNGSELSQSEIQTNAQSAFTVSVSPPVVTPPTNSPPTVEETITGSASVNEGDSGTYSIGATDPDGDQLTYAWSVVSGSATITSLTDGSSVDLDFTDGPSTVDLRVVVGDGQTGHDVTRNLSISVANVNPTADLTNDGPKPEGSAVTASFSSADDVAADTTSGLKFAFRCDGDTTLLPTTYTGAGATSSVQCTYADNGSFTIAGRVFDKDNGYNTYTTAVTVDNAAPLVAAPRWQSSTIDCGQSATLTNISFSDAGVNDDPWTVQIDWGDGSQDYSGNTTTQGTQGDQSHTYAMPGTYTATVTVTDKDGGSDANDTADNGNLTVVQSYKTTFLAPLDGSTPSKLIANTMKKGRVVPIKVTIFDNCTGQYVTDPQANVTIDVKTAAFTTSSTDAVETFSDAGASSGQTTAFRFNADSSMASGGFWIYNLDTNGFTIGTTYQVAPKVGSILANNTFAILKPTK